MYIESCRRAVVTIALPSKSLSSVEKRYSNIEREALGILHGLDKFHHYCFVRVVSIIADHKPLVTIFKKEVAIQSQRIHQILLRIYQCRVRIIYKPGLDLFIMDWLSRQNHKENKDVEIPAIQLNIDARQTVTNIPPCCHLELRV